MAFQFLFDAIGTKWVVDIYDDFEESKYIQIEKIVKDKVEQFEQRYSRFRPSSWLNTMSHKVGRYELPDDAEKLLSLYRDLYRDTNGLVTPMIGQVLVDAGYDKDYSFKQKKDLEQPLSWDEVFVYKPPFITIKKPVQLDLGALGKGYIIDIVGKLLETEGVKAYCVDAGRDVLYKNPNNEPLAVGLEHPQDFNQVIGVANIINKSIAGSAGNRRSWGKFNHIINPKTLSSPNEIIALWAIADSALLADAMTTALFFAKAEDLVKKYNFEYVIVRSDMSVEQSHDTGNMIELYTS